MNKKAALELSMNTIIIIVIGVVILSLGLMFVRGVFTQTIDLSDKVFAGANRELDDLGGGVSRDLTISPETVRVKAGKTSGFLVQVTNLEDEETYSGLTGTLSSIGPGISCEFVDGTTPTQINIRTLVPGAEDRIKVMVRTQKGSLGTKHCKFKLNGLREPAYIEPEIIADIMVS